MDFEEKIDAMRMNLELAFHDIEALRASIEAQRAASETQRAAIEAQRAAFEADRGSIRELRDASAHQFETAQVLMRATENLLATANRHDQRITGLERRA
jgi:outer membrane protein TolC